MKHIQTSQFQAVELERLLAMVEDFSELGYRYVQTCATTRDDSCDLLYSFVDPEDITAIRGINVNIPDGVHVPSITSLYPAAFVFENEAHDLFGIDFDGLNVDFEGEFYTVAVPYPMNPRAASLENKQGEEACDE